MIAWGGPLRRAALLASGGALLALFARRVLGRRFARYEVQGRSMLPALAPGDYVIVDYGAYRQAAPRLGDVVLLRDPRDPRREVVKRIRRVASDHVWVEGDNPAASTDSRTYGHVSSENVLGRVRWRYWRSGGPV